MATERSGRYLYEDLLGQDNLQRTTYTRGTSHCHRFCFSIASLSLAKKSKIPWNKTIKSTLHLFRCRYFAKYFIFGFTLSCYVVLCYVMFSWISFYFIWSHFIQSILLFKNSMLFLSHYALSHPALSLLVCLSVSLSVVLYLFLFLFVCLCVSVNLSVCLSVIIYLSAYLSVIICLPLSSRSSHEMNYNKYTNT